MPVVVSLSKSWTSLGLHAYKFSNCFLEHEEELKVTWKRSRDEDPRSLSHDSRCQRRRRWRDTPIRHVRIVKFLDDTHEDIGFTKYCGLVFEQTRKACDNRGCDIQ